MGTVPETYDPRGRNIDGLRAETTVCTYVGIINDQRSVRYYHLLPYWCAAVFNELKKEVHHIDEMDHGHPSDDSSSTW